MIIALVGMPGSGKSEVCQFFKNRNIPVLRFGDLTEEEIAKQGLALTPANEKKVREALRKKHGMAVYAKKIKPKADKALLNSSLVVLDGLYSWEEYLHLKKAYGSELRLVAIVASPTTRHSRLIHRPVRPLTVEEAQKRDHAEIENLNKGGPIAMADFYIVNEEDKKSLLEQVAQLERTIRI